MRLTLAEADFLFDHKDALGIRELIITRLQDRYARKVFADLDQLARADRTGLRFRDEVVGPLNRLAEFTSAPAIRRIVGQREGTIDLRQALDEGHIILVNLSGGDAVNDADCELLGRLLTRFVFFHVKRRTTVRAFWMYLDECQRYLSGDIPSLLAEARKFHTGVVLSHQWQSQLMTESDQILAAVHNATNLKVAFRVKHPREAQELAEAIIPLDLEMPVQRLVRPTIVGHQRTLFESWSETDSESWGTAISETTSETHNDTEGESASDTITDSMGWSTAQTASRSQTQTYDGWNTVAALPVQTAISAAGADTTGTSGGTSSAHAEGSSSSSSTSTSRGETVTETYAHSHAETHGASEGLEPIYETLPTAVHSYQNALYLAAQQLRSLAAGEAYASFVDSEGFHSARLQVPHVKAIAVTEKTFGAVRSFLFSRSPSALETPQATAQLEHCQKQLELQAQEIARSDPEPETFRVPARRKRHPE